MRRRGNLEVPETPALRQGDGRKNLLEKEKNPEEVNPREEEKEKKKEKK